VSLVAGGWLLVAGGWFWLLVASSSVDQLPATSYQKNLDSLSDFS
jgi:hypothetical protein